jgi:hypothetical protein
MPQLSGVRFELALLMFKEGAGFPSQGKPICTSWVCDRNCLEACRR